MLRPVATLLGSALLLATGGCCSLARLFCGPDLSPWVQQSFESPEDTVRTFMEAARRDDAVVVFSKCLSEDYKLRLRAQYGGDGSFGAVYVWDQLKRQAPLHMLGYAEIRDSKQEGDRASCTLDVDGRRIRLELVRQAYRLVKILDQYGNVGKIGGWVRSLGPKNRIVNVDDQPPSRLEIDQFELKREDLGKVTLDQIVFAGIGHEWKVDQIDLLKNSAPAND
jgi:hypothetical protein